MQKAESFSIIFRYITPLLLSFATWTLTDIKSSLEKTNDKLSDMEKKYDKRFDDSNTMHTGLVERVTANEVRIQEMRKDTRVIKYK